MIRPVREIKWAYQRADRGFSDKDAWNGDSFLAGQIAGILRWQVNNGIGIAMGYLPLKEQFSDLEMNIAVEARNSEYLYYAEVFEEYAKNGPAMDEKWQEKFGGVLDKDLSDALQWFSEHFTELWD